ncbi:MAG TPA: helix-turn-helix transcriptional regulator [Myxococcota bacterium]|nr:helix-turn-helix transcriptional regulator [Myxococcota bacterium]
MAADRVLLVDRFERDGWRFDVAHEPARVGLHGLSARERSAAEGLGRGLAPKEIAYAQGVAPSTVANALGRARRKLGLRSLAELAALFAPNGLRAIDAALLAPLSAAEREVALLLVRGASNREIARRRGAAVRTVANQARAVYRKLGVASRAELAARLHGAIA